MSNKSPFTNPQDAPSPTTAYEDVVMDPIESAVKTILTELDYHGPNFDGTPERVARMYRTFRGPEPPKMASFPLEARTGMVIVADHECWSFCPHHLLPVKYMIKVGYLPRSRKVLGLSKLARICDEVMKEMPLQEEIGYKIVQPIVDELNPRGAGAVVRGEHQCMRMRGVESSHATGVTTYLWGFFLDNNQAGREFLSL